MFAVVIHEKGGAERRETFETAELTVGRVQGNELMLPKGNVSKRHARLLYRDGRFIVTDLNSTNGTYINGKRLAAYTDIATKNGTTVQAVGALAAQKIYNEAKPGTYLMVNGRWVKK